MPQYHLPHNTGHTYDVQHVQANIEGGFLLNGSAVFLNPHEEVKIPFRFFSMQVQTTDSMQQTTCKIPVRSCSMNVRPTTGMNEYNMQMCSIQLTTCKCAAYNLQHANVQHITCQTRLFSFGAARLCRAAVGRDALQRPCRAAARHRCAAVGRPARTAVRTRHGSVNARHGTQCNLRTPSGVALRCGDYDGSCIRLDRTVTRCCAVLTVPLRSTATSTLLRSRQQLPALQADDRGEHSEPVALECLPVASEPHRPVPSPHATLPSVIQPATCNSVERPKSCPDTCAKCSRE